MYIHRHDGIINQTAIEELKNGVLIGFNGKKYLTKNCKSHLLVTIPNFPERAKKIRDERHGPTSWISITINEGKFRQVRKMTSAVGFPTLRLVRVRVGELHLNDLKPGEVVEVDSFEV